MRKKQTITPFVQIIHEKGIRRTILAKKTGIPYSRITTLIMNTHLEPSLSEAIKISKFLEKPMEELFPESYSKVS